MTHDSIHTPKRVFSGIQPTGDIHIGNYFGAIQNYVKLGNMLGKNSVYCIVDYHAITIHHDPEQLRKLTLEAALVNIASGLDPNKVILFAQSDVREHTELGWVFATQTPLGDLERMTQFKDKSQQHGVLTGLLTYPVLMAADILLYLADTVPVGEDQKQHLELTREVARRFNNRFQPIFPEPMAFHAPNALRVPGIDGNGKMSKSKGNTIGVLEPLNDIWDKLKTAPTDPARVRRADPGNPERCLIFDYHNLFSTAQTIQMVDTECRQAGIGCVDCKKMLHTAVTQTLTPIQEKAADLQRNMGIVKDALLNGADEARSIAAPVMHSVRDALGLHHP